MLLCNASDIRQPLYSRLIRQGCEALTIITTSITFPCFCKVRLCASLLTNVRVTFHCFCNVRLCVSLLTNVRVTFPCFCNVRLCVSLLTNVRVMFSPCNASVMCFCVCHTPGSHCILVSFGRGCEALTIITTSPPVLCVCVCVIPFVGRACLCVLLFKPLPAGGSECRFDLCRFKYFFIYTFCYHIAFFRRRSFVSTI